MEPAASELEVDHKRRANCLRLTRHDAGDSHGTAIASMAASSRQRKRALARVRNQEAVTAARRGRVVRGWLVATAIFATVLASPLMSTAQAAPSNAWSCDSSGGLGHRTPVLLVHGYDSSASTWSTQTQQYLASNSSTTCVTLFDYGAYSTDWVTNPNIGPALAARILTLANASQRSGGPGKVIIVAHSMGGLATRCAADPVCSGLSGVAGKIRAVVTFDSPSLGTWLKGYGRSDLADLVGPFFGALCVGTDNGLSTVKAVCDELRAWGTSAAVKAFTPGSAQLRELPAMPTSIPVLALAGSVKVATSFFGHDVTAIGDVGDLIVSEQSALADARVVDGIGGARVEDCGYIDITQPVTTFTLQCSHITETNNDQFLSATLHFITDVERHDSLAEPLPRIAQTTQSAGALQALLARAGLSSQVFPLSACASVAVEGAVFSSEAADVQIAHTFTPGCSGLAFGTFYVIRSGSVTAHAEECDCGDQTRAFLALRAPYANRGAAAFQTDGNGQLIPGAGIATPPLLQVVRDGPILYEPSSFVFTVDSTGDLDALTWSTWGLGGAIATGTLRLDTCIPDCASGPFNSYPATIRLSGVSEIHSPYFTVFTIDSPTAPGGSQTFTIPR